MAKLDPKLYAEMERKCMELFTYEQRFFFLNGARTTGKTYTLQKLMVKKALARGEEIGYFLRTKDEYDNGAVMAAFEKVLAREFPELLVVEKKNDIYVRSDENGQWRRLVVGFPISMYYKYKNRSFPLVTMGLFDEYMLEVVNGITQGRYVDGFSEPDHFINLYNTIDRAEGRLRVFFCGNNTSFYNPYHIHAMFNAAFKRVPPPGAMIKTPNVVFWRVQPSPELERYLSETMLGRMAEGTQYGSYAFRGEYQDDVRGVTAICAGAKTVFALRYSNTTVYVHTGTHTDRQRAMWISSTGGTGVPIYAVRGNDVSQDIPLFFGTYWHDIFSDLHRRGRIFFATQKAKSACDAFLYLILSWYRKG